VVKPAEKAAAPRPSQEPAKPTPKPEPAKPDEAGEAAKHPGQPAGSAKKAGKSTLASMPSSAALAAGKVEIVYWLKLRSLPPGAQITIDGEPMGQAPLQRRILDVDKPHAVSIHKLGFESYEHVVTSGDAWEKDGNTATLKIFVKLKRSKAQAAPVPSAQPEAQPEPVPEKL
jgi:hypothetical protein